jgi:hypothetical protein
MFMSMSMSMSIEAVVLSSVIVAQEYCDVATIDIPGAIIQADMDKVVQMQLWGKMADLLVSIDPTKS